MLVMTHSEEETRACARDLAASLQPQDVIALEGELGSGKTRFVQGLAAGLGVPQGVFVRSPTFALLNVYRGGRLPLYHFDFYRIEGEGAFEDLGFDEYFEGDGICVIEWADRFPHALPDHVQRVRIHILDATEREIEISAQE